MSIWAKSKGLVLTVLLFTGQGVWAEGAEDALMARVAREGCAIGPEMMARAEADGIDPAELTALAEAALAAGEAERLGAWVLIGRARCEITVPQVAAPVTLADPDIVTQISAPDHFAEFDEPGCYILTDHGLAVDLARNRGWWPDVANAAYLAFLAQEIGAGRITFFSNDPLKTPPAFQVLVGTGCEAVETVPEIRASQAWLRANFDAILRHAAQELPCGSRVTLLDLSAEARADLGVETGQTNSWVLFEAYLLAVGAGWVEGVTAEDRGTPRPPLCHPGLAAE